MIMEGLLLLEQQWPLERLCSPIGGPSWGWLSREDPGLDRLPGWSGRPSMRGWDRSPLITRSWKARRPPADLPRHRERALPASFSPPLFPSSPAPLFRRNRPCCLGPITSFARRQRSIRWVLLAANRCSVD